MKNLWIPLASALSLSCLAASVYSLDARELGVVTSFGKPVETVTEPGLHLRVPWPIHQVQTFYQRALAAWLCCPNDGRSHRAATATSCTRWR